MYKNSLNIKKLNKKHIINYVTYKSIFLKKKVSKYFNNKKFQTLILEYNTLYWKKKSFTTKNTYFKKRKYIKHETTISLVLKHIHIFNLLKSVIYFYNAKL